MCSLQVPAGWKRCTVERATADAIFCCRSASAVASSESLSSSALHVGKVFWHRCVTDNVGPLWAVPPSNCVFAERYAGCIVSSRRHQETSLCAWQQVDRQGLNVSYVHALDSSPSSDTKAQNTGDGGATIICFFNLRKELS